MTRSGSSFVNVSQPSASAASTDDRRSSIVTSSGEWPASSFDVTRRQSNATPAGFQMACASAQIRRTNESATPLGATTATAMGGTDPWSATHRRKVRHIAIMDRPQWQSPYAFIGRDDARLSRAIPIADPEYSKLQRDASGSD